MLTLVTLGFLAPSEYVQLFLVSAALCRGFCCRVARPNASATASSCALASTRCTALFHSCVLGQTPPLASSCTLPPAFLQVPVDEAVRTRSWSSLPVLIQGSFRSRQSGRSRVVCPD